MIYYLCPKVFRKENLACQIFFTENKLITKDTAMYCCLRYVTCLFSVKKKQLSFLACYFFFTGNKLSKSHRLSTTPSHFQDRLKNLPAPKKEPRVTPMTAPQALRVMTPTERTMNLMLAASQKRRRKKRKRKERRESQKDRKDAVAPQATKAKVPTLLHQQDRVILHHI